MITSDVVDLVVIDDDNDLRMLTSITFRMQGWNVVTASDGSRGLQLLHDLAAVGTQPAVLLDVQMPDIDGWEVLRTIRSDEQLEDLAVILCTVRAGEDSIALGMQLGADGFVPKPFDVDEIVDVVRAFSQLSPHERRERRRRWSS